jgi:sugar (pentulose or hexulose) kinase
VTWIQYVAFLLSGKLVTEISSIACQTHLLNIRDGGYSSLVKRMGWEPLFPPMAKAKRWHRAVNFKGFRGRGAVLAGVHDLMRIISVISRAGRRNSPAFNRHRSSV